MASSGVSTSPSKFLVQHGALSRQVKWFQVLRQGRSVVREWRLAPGSLWKPCPGRSFESEWRAGSRYFWKPRGRSVGRIAMSARDSVIERRAYLRSCVRMNTQPVYACYHVRRI